MKTHGFPKHPGVYAIRHAESGRSYIGSAKNIYNRWRGHRSELRRGIHHSPHLQNAWSKYGEAAFTFVVLEACLPDGVMLLSREQHWLDYCADRLFNAARHAAPNTGKPCTADQKAHMSRLMKGNRNGAGSHYCGRLTEANVVEILYRYAAGERGDRIAARFGVHPQHLPRIYTRKIWANVQVPPEIDAACRLRGKRRGQFAPVVLPIPEPAAVVKPAKPRKSSARRPCCKPRPARIPVSCPHCGKGHEVPPCQFRKQASFYCSKPCRLIGMRARVKAMMADPARRAAIAETNRGKHHTDETRQKMSESHRRRLSESPSGTGTT